MRHALKVILIAMALSTLAVAHAHAGQIWTDGNGDGLPDAGPIVVAPNTDFTVGVWIDAQSFNWSNYRAYVEWPAGCVTYQSAAYVISGGINFPIDDFTLPNGVGFSGTNFNESGVDHVGIVSLQASGLTACCVVPLISPYSNPYYVFSELSRGDAYQLFTTNPGTCISTLDPPSSGACCFSDRSCQMLAADDCVSAGGVYMGDFTPCEGVSCGPPFVGACCLPDGACQILIESDCAGVGGVYAGNDVSCADANCPPTQACCFCGDGSCQDLTPAACVAAGGILQGPGTSCGTIICECPPPVGACCLGDGSCVDFVLQDNCAALGGVWYLSQRCTEVQCIPSNSVEPTTWGKIKTLFR